MKVLLIEDDLTIRTVLSDALTCHHWTVEQAADGEAGLELAATRDYDLILLDIGLPRLDGITVCKQLRQGGYQNSILLMTGKDSTAAQIAGLDAGADDYVPKPFNLEILLARMRALARKGQPVPSVMTWETVRLNPSNSEVTCSGQLVHLTAKEYCLLELFLLNPKRIYSRRAILDRLWDFADAPGEETVSTHIKCIRQKLKAAGGGDPIETVYGLGYRLRPVAVPPPDSVSVPAPLLVAEQVSSFDQIPQSHQKAQAVAAKVWDQFKPQYLEQIQTLESLVGYLRPQAVIEDCPLVRQMAHKLVGSLGMFGLQRASQQARRLEQLMQPATLEAAQIAEAAQIVAALKQEIEQFQAVLPPKLQPLATQSSPTTLARLLIVDDDLLLADGLRIEAVAWNLKVEIATDLTVARQMINQSAPDLILLDLSFPGEENGLTLMRELDQRSPTIPVVIFTAKEDLQDRVTAARLGARAFLHKPLPAYEILKTVTDVLYQTAQTTDNPRLLVVDDDPGFLQLLSTLLHEHGLQVTTSVNPRDFWQVLVDCHPDVLILDVEMPEFDGIELCQAVRTDPQWSHLKVLFLSAHTDSEVIVRAYAAGADDYIDKARSVPDLVAHILHRIGQR